MSTTRGTSSYMEMIAHEEKAVYASFRNPKTRVGGALTLCEQTRMFYFSSPLDLRIMKLIQEVQLPTLCTVRESHINRSIALRVLFV